MVNLTQIIEEGFRGVGSAAKGIVVGVARGIYTPALLITGLRKYDKEFTICMIYH